MATCAQCGLEVSWKRGPKGWQCFDADGKVHWDRCSGERFRRIQREGQFFSNETAEGYRHSMKTQYTMLRPGYLIRGKAYRPDACTCGLPPWELCKPSCQHAIAARA